MRNTRTLIGAALIAGGSLLFAGCVGDDDDDGGGGPPQATQTPTSTPTTGGGQNPTPTPTTPTGGDPTVTPTTGTGGRLEGEDAAKAAAGIALGFSELADIAAGFAGGSAAGQGAGFLPPVSCPNGGTVDVSCTPAGADSQVGLVMDGCQVVAPGLSEFVGTGTIDLVIPISNFCITFQVPPSTQIDATFNGMFEFANLTLALFTSTTFDDFQVQLAVDSADTVTLTMDGAADVNCVGPITIQTTDEIVIPADSCPTAGAIAVDLEDGTVAEITYATDPAVTVDYEGDVTTFNDCEDPELNACGQS